MGKPYCLPLYLPQSMTVGLTSLVPHQPPLLLVSSGSSCSMWPWLIKGSASAGLGVRAGAGGQAAEQLVLIDAARHVGDGHFDVRVLLGEEVDRKSTRLNS